MTTTDTPARRVRVKHEPLPGAKPWRAVLVDPTVPQMLDDPLPVGRFDTQHEAVTAGVSALRFHAAGIPWAVTE
jgi:hypothetical protein